jgi:predicted Fe-Mo cluster-binding NifX family protein
MKIAFPLVNERELAVDFMHSRYIGIYDDVNGKTEFIPVDGIEKHIGVALFFDALTSQGLKSVISPFYSYMSLRVFKENEIETLKAIGNNLEENIGHFKESSLKPFDVYESLINKDCVSDCSGCGSKCSEN